MFAWLSGKTVKNPELKEAESVFTVEELKLIQNRFQEEVAHYDGEQELSTKVSCHTDFTVDGILSRVFSKKN